MRFDFVERLNLITGDNGMGKSFVLELAWWAIAHTWIGAPAYPKRDDRTPHVGSSPAEISFEVRNRVARTEQSVRFDARAQRWHRPAPDEAVTDALVLYARVDGGYAVFDPLRNARHPVESDGAPALPAFVFEREQVWDGLWGEGRKRVCNGLIDDWVRWQLGDPDAFAQLKRALRHLSPGGDEPLEPGEPTRVALDDTRDIPTLRTPYGLVPVTVASAGVRRILALAYLLVWSWREHRQAAQLIDQAPSASEIVLVVDELEAHLHPLWQRRLVPALLDTIEGLTGGIPVQVMATTHAPLVLVSAEPYWDDRRDALFVMDLGPVDGSGRAEPVVKKEEFIPRGNPSYWLESDAFDGTPLRSDVAEGALRELRDIVKNGADPERARELYQRLARLTAPGDPLLIQIQASLSRRGIEV